MSKSARLRLGDVRNVFRLLGEMKDLRYDAVSRDRHMVESLCRMLGARQGAAVRMSGYTATGEMRLHGLVGAGWVDPAAARTWAEVLGQGNPRNDLLVDRSSKVDRKLFVIRRQDLIPDDEWERLRHPYVDFVRETHVVAHLATIQRIERPDDVLAITLHRTGHDHNFTARDCNVLRMFSVELYRARAKGLIDPPFVMPRLSPRQRQVLKRLLVGDSVKQAATHLSLARQTTADHVQRIYEAFGVNSRGELLAKFIGAGMPGFLDGEGPPGAKT